MSLCIVTVNWNCPHFLEVQLPLIKRHLKPDCIYVVDTSTEVNLNKAIASNNGASYAHITFNEGDYSRSHATALNFAYQYLKGKYDIIGFLDHDCFPIADMDVMAEIEGVDFLSIDQVRGDVIYPHPGYLFMKTNTNFNIDFTPIQGLDTAGQLHKVYGYRRQMTYEHRGGYELINKSLLHIVKGSVWNGEPETRQRVNEVFEYVKTLA